MAPLLEYFIVFYAPEALGNTRINLGIVLLCPDGKASVRFVSDWKRIQDLQPDSDIEMVRAICNDIEKQIKNQNAHEIVRIMEDSFSNEIQLSERMQCQTNDQVEVMNGLAVRYLHA